MLVVIGNLLWFILGGGVLAWAGWVITGILLAITVVGFPFALAAWRIARFAAFPFGKELVDAQAAGGRRIIGTGVANFLWIILAGIWLTIGHVVAGIGYCVSIVGIPFALAHFKLAAISFAPLGKKIIYR